MINGIMTGVGRFTLHLTVWDGRDEGLLEYL